MGQRSRKRQPIVIQSAPARPAGRNKPETHTSTNSPVDTVMQLQRTIGNRATSQLLRAGSLQAKLAIGAPGDRYEREADSVAQHVVSMPEPAVQRVSDEKKKKLQTAPLASTITPLVQTAADEKKKELQKAPAVDEKKKRLQPKGMPDIAPDDDKEKKRELQRAVAADDRKKEQQLLRKAGEEEEEPLQAQSASRGGRTATATVSSPVEHAIDTGRGGGRPLSEGDRAYFEPRFGASFGDVRVHTDSQAAQLSSNLNAQAFTVGKDVYFGAGKFETGSSAGKSLLAHELTHVVQQNSSIEKKSAPINQNAPVAQDAGQQIQCDFTSSAKKGWEMYTGMTDEGADYAKKLMRWRIIGLGADYRTTVGDDWDDFMSNRPEIQRAMADRLAVLSAKFASIGPTGNEWFGGWKPFTDNITGVKLNELESMRLTLHGCHRISIIGQYWVGPEENGTIPVKFGGVKFVWIDRADLHPGITTELASGKEVDDKEFTGAGFDYDIYITFLMPGISTWEISGGSGTHKKGWPPITGAPAAGFRG